MSENKNSVSEIPREIPLERTYPDDLKSFFISNMVIQHESDHFIISFFEIWPPVILGSSEERERTINNLNHIEAKCVSRLVVMPDKMREFIDVMNNNYDSFLKSTQRINSDDDSK
jgi:hypothetical protein